MENFLVEADIFDSFFARLAVERSNDEVAPDPQDPDDACVDDEHHEVLHDAGDHEDLDEDCVDDRHHEVLHEAGEHEVLRDAELPALSAQTAKAAGRVLAGSDRPKSPVRVPKAAALAFAPWRAPGPTLPVPSAASSSTDPAVPAPADQEGAEWEEWEDDWGWAESAEETAAAIEHRIRWQDRGPPGPDEEHQTWRRQQWRKGSQRWGNRGGKRKGWWGEYYSALGQGATKEQAKAHANLQFPDKNQ